MNLRDLVKDAEEISTSFFQNFFTITISPHKAFQLLVENQQNSYLLKGAITYSALALTLGFGLAKFLRIGGVPETIDWIAVGGELIFPVIFIWAIYGIALHLMAILLGGTGTITQTVSVFLYIYATLHLLFIILIWLLSSVFPSEFGYELAIRKFGESGEILHERSWGAFGTDLFLGKVKLSTLYYYITIPFIGVYLYWPLRQTHNLSSLKVFAVYFFSIFVSFLIVLFLLTLSRLVSASRSIFI